MLRELVDDLRRWKRDREMNTHQYARLNKRVASGVAGVGVGMGASIWEHVSSSDLQVGDIVQLQQDHRVPADLVLLRTGSNSLSFYSILVLISLFFI